MQWCGFVAMLTCTSCMHLQMANWPGWQGPTTACQYGLGGMHNVLDETSFILPEYAGRK
jgi:hypothetical protein